MPELARVQEKVSQLEDDLKEIKELINTTAKVSHEDDIRIHERIDGLEKRVRNVEQEVKEIILKIPGTIKDLESKIMNKMDSEQVETLKGIIQTNKGNMSKLLWLAIGSIFSIVTAMALSFLSRFFFE